MGKQIKGSGYTSEEMDVFRSKLEKEMKILRSWFKNKSFVNNDHKVGIELEAWLVDQNMLPDPFGPEFLKGLNHEQIVPEIAKFNFEINSSPYKLQGKCFSKLEKEMSTLWGKASKQALDNNRHALLVGTLPTLRPHMLSMEYLSPQNRYAVMNEQVMKMRDGKPLYIRLEGKDSLYMYMDSVIAECAATSLQIHLGINQDQGKRYYNASCIAVPFLIALSANSPYFFGKELWDESRIAVFEQAVDIDAKGCKGNTVKRVTLGNGYIKNCLSELYEENLADYPIMLAEDLGEVSHKLKHLSLHNGTIWRWTRPIIGIDDNGAHHLRIEQRTPSAGPTVKDAMANSMFFIGLIDYLANMKTPPEDLINYDEAIHNFYKSSRQSFFCQVRWIDGKLYDIKDLLQYEIFPHVKQALLQRGIDKEEVKYYMDEIIFQRIKKGVNGAVWQKAFIHMKGKRFQELIECYIENQQTGKPVHLWDIK